MRVTRVAEGLWRWTTAHPDWTPQAHGWDAEVGSVYLEAPGAIVLVDPLIPAEDQAERFWTALDRDVERLGLPVVVMLTVPWHVRGAGAVLARYPGSRLRAAGGPGPVPVGLEVLAVPAALEELLWIPRHGALVAGDVLLGDGTGGLRLCPESWVSDGPGLDVVRRELAPALELPVRVVLTSHGEPVLHDGRAALAAALSPPR